MINVVIKDVGYDELMDFIIFCIPDKLRSLDAFNEGIRLKERWAGHIIEKYGSVGKIAYYQGRCVGIIQYVPIPEEKIYEIICIYVHNRFLRKGVGRALLKSVLNDSMEPKDYFGGEPPDALVTWAFEVPGLYPQHEFFIKMGFKQVYSDNPYLLYYPIKDGFEYVPKERHYIPQEEDCGRALLFINPNCPFCIYFLEKGINLIREVASDLPIKVINEFEEYGEVRKRGSVPFCIVNGHPIKVFFTEEEEFKQEVWDALGKPCPTGPDKQ